MLSKIIAMALLTSTVVFSHCDSLDGPVVQAARRALSTDDVNLVLPWVQPSQESTIRQAFVRAKAVRTLNKDAEKLADTWFFETLVRIHRAGEGAPYEGLKPAGSDVGSGVLAADRAIVQGDVKMLQNSLTSGIREGLQQRFMRVLQLKDYQPANVNAGREYVAAYVEFVHFVERLDETLKKAVREHGGEHAH